MFFEYGEERHSRRVARRIVEARRVEPITTTGRLAELVRRSIPGKWGPIDPATRVFQALRIAVNDELGHLDAALADLPDVAQARGPGRDHQLPLAGRPPRQVRLPRRPEADRPDPETRDRDGPGSGRQPPGAKREIEGRRAMSESGWNPASDPESGTDSPQELSAGPLPPGVDFPKVDWGAPPAPTAGDDLDEEDADELEDSPDGGEEDEDEARPPADEDDDGGGPETAAAGSRASKVLAGLGAAAGGAGKAAAKGVELARRYPRASLASGLSSAILAAVMVVQPGKGKHDTTAQIPGPQAPSAGASDPAGLRPDSAAARSARRAGRRSRRGAGADPRALAGGRGTPPDKPEDRARPASDAGEKAPASERLADNMPHRAGPGRRPRRPGARPARRWPTGR